MDPVLLVRDDKRPFHLKVLKSVRDLKLSVDGDIDLRLAGGFIDFEPLRGRTDSTAKINFDGFVNLVTSVSAILVHHDGDELRSARAE